MQSFDLRELSSRVYKAKRLGRFAIMGMTLMFLVFILLRAVSTAHWTLVYYIDVPGGIAVVAIVWAVYLTVLAPSPTQVTVSDVGVEFLYGPRRKMLLEWRDPRFRLTMRDVTKLDPDYLDRAGWLSRAEVLNWIGTWPITPEAMSAIVQAASDHGLSITWTKSHGMYAPIGGDDVIIRSPMDQTNVAAGP
jgi:hypothetical protein